MQLDSWQEHVLDVALGEQDDGRWAARSVGLVVPRQNGKGSILEALILAALVLFDEQLVLYSAHHFRTAQEMFLRMRALLEGCDDLARRVSRVHSAHGAEGIEMRSGHRLRFVARSAGAVRGLSPQRVILDEALILTTKSVRAQLFAMSAQENPQLWYVSSAPEDTEEGGVLRSVMRRGRAGDESLAYLEWSADPASGLTDRDAWAAANPGFPHRISADTIIGELAEMTEDPDGFRRERLGVVNLDESGTEWRVIPEAAWQSRADPKHLATEPVSYAVDADVNAKGELWVSIGASDGVHHELVTPLGDVELPDGSKVKVGPGTGWVVPACVKRRDRFDELTIDPNGPAGVLVGPLERAGLTVRTLKRSEVATASAQLLDAVVEGPFVHLDQPALNVAAAGVLRREVGDGTWRFSRKLSSVDVGPLMAVAFARHAAATRVRREFRAMSF